MDASSPLYFNAALEYIIKKVKKKKNEGFHLNRNQQLRVNADDH